MSLKICRFRLLDKMKEKCIKTTEELQMLGLSAMNLHIL